MGEEHGEFVPTQPGKRQGFLIVVPRHRVGLSHAMEQPFGHLTKNRISALRAERIVDALKPIEINEENSA